MIPDEWEIKSNDASKAFTPAAPIDQTQLFAGRKAQLTSIIDVINQKGQHAIIFGERGVGKTSLANEIARIPQHLALRVNADSSDSFSSLWKKVFEGIVFTKDVEVAGFKQEPRTETSSLMSQVPHKITTDVIRKTLIGLPIPTVIIIDEFDRITNTPVKSTMADTIKTLSDHSVNATIILVGVADSVDQLIKEHQSIERALVQVKMPRMSDDELGLIIDNGLKILNMSIDADARKHIILLSQGLPHYTHLLALNATRQALSKHENNIRYNDVETAIVKAIQNAQQTTLSSYHKSISSPRKDNIFAQVLLACALAHTDEMGYFAAADVRDSLSMIMGKKYEIPSYSRHLNEFCDPKRGPILSKIGKKHSFRFRFVNPLMQPFITMQGFANRLIDQVQMEKLSNK